MFDIQLFADTVSSSYELKIQFGYTDEDTHLYTLKNPDADDTDTLATNIAELNNWVTDTQVILSDKSSASTTGINYAYVEQKTITKLDIS